MCIRDSASNHVVWRIKRENRSNGLVSRGCDETKKRSKHSKVLGVYFTYVGGKTPSADWAQIFWGRRYPRRNHVFQIWWRSVQGFSVSWGSNFAIPHWLRRSSFQHSHTTVWACDRVLYKYFTSVTSCCRTASPSPVTLCHTPSDPSFPLKAWHIFEWPLIRWLKNFD